MQRWATTASDSRPLYSAASASRPSNGLLVRPAAAAARRASVSATSSRSMPTTGPERGASASASRPRPVPTSRTVRPARSSSARSVRNAGLIAGSAGDGPIRRRRNEARILRHHAPGVAGLRLLHGTQALLQLARAQLGVETAPLDAYDDRVAAPGGPDRSSAAPPRRVAAPP